MRMRKHVGPATLLLALLVAAGFGSYALADGGKRNLRETLEGYQEVPAVSTKGSGEFNARIDDSAQEIRYRLSYEDLEGAVTQAHIHFAQKSVNGNIAVFLCSNLGNGPAGTQACPASPATISGTIRPADVTAGAAAQGLAAGEFAELLDAIRADATYVNVHSATFPGGEVRAQLETRHRDHD
jgi:hypothetical protein